MKSGSLFRTVGPRLRFGDPCRVDPCNVAEEADTHSRMKIIPALAIQEKKVYIKSNRFAANYLKKSSCMDEHNQNWDNNRKKRDVCGMIAGDKSMKKTLFLFFACVLICSILAGCNPSAAKSATKFLQKSKQTIIY